MLKGFTLLYVEDDPETVASLADILEVSVKERNKIIKDLISITKKDSDQIELLRLTLGNIINGSDNIPIEDKVLLLCKDLIDSEGDTCTKKMLEDKLIDNKIPARYIRDLGGVKIIKKKVAEKYKNLDPEIIQENETSM